jgi:hypothetical protein
VTTSSQSVYYRAASSQLCATLTWNGPVQLSLIVYTDSSGTKVLTQNTTGVSGESVSATAVAGNIYKIKARPLSGSGSSSYTLTITS